MKRRMTLHLLGGLLATAGLVVRAQPARMARLGVVEYGPPPDSAQTRGYLEELAALGWREGTTLGVERRFASGQPERFAELLRELAAQPVDLMFAPGHDIAKVAKMAIAQTPVVTVGSEDPIRSGLIGSFSQPGGSVTGVSFMSPELAGKRLELLKDMVPGLARVAVLWEPAHADTYYRQLGDVAATMGMRVQLVTVDSVADMERAFAEIARSKPQALFVVPSRLANLQTRRIVDFALAAKLPAVSAYESFAEAGGLMTYGADTGEALKRAAAQSDRILKGARPGDVPFELPTRFRLTLNLKTATALGLAIPQAIVLRADRVVE